MPLFVLILGCVDTCFGIVELRVYVYVVKWHALNQQIAELMRREVKALVFHRYEC